jgi:hypothetical protein
MVWIPLGKCSRWYTWDGHLNWMNWEQIFERRGVWCYFILLSNGQRVTFFGLKQPIKHAWSYSSTLPYSSWCSTHLSKDPALWLPWPYPFLSCLYRWFLLCRLPKRSMMYMTLNVLETKVEISFDTPWENFLPQVLRTVYILRAELSPLPSSRPDEVDRWWHTYQLLCSAKLIMKIFCNI